VSAPLAYSPRALPLAALNALAATVYLGSLALVAFLFSNPIILAGAGGAALAVGATSGAGRAVRAALRWALVLGAVLVVVNGIASQRGDTILANGIPFPLVGSFDISAEALAEGGVLALRVIVVLVVFAVHAATVDPDQLLRLARPLARRSALTASILTRLVPLAVADYERLGETAALRGPGAAPVGRAALARSVVAGSLDRALDVAATLELRGFSSGAPRAIGPLRRSRHDLKFLASGLAITAMAVTGLALGLGGFDAYPLLFVATEPATLVLSMALPVLALAPIGAARG
jgi:energy-coupling factor transport system permease protein